MLPVLFRLGPFTLRTLPVFLIVALIGSAFLFWRKSREEHYDETQVFDGFLSSAVFGLLGSRIAFIIFNFGQFGFSPLKWINIFQHPGYNIIFGLLIAALFLRRFAIKHKWDMFEILDFWVTAVSFGLGVLWLGMLVDGTGFGNPTTMPWGIVFPGVFEKHHPVQLYFAVFYFVLFYYLSWAEYRYRTFSWYRAGKNTAQTGYLTSIFLTFTGLFSLGMAFLRPGQLVVGGVPLDLGMYLILFVGGCLLLLNRSGRSLLPTGKRGSPFKNAAG